MTTATGRLAPAPPDLDAHASHRHDIGPAVEACLTDFVTERVTGLVSLDAALEPLARTAARAVLDGGKRLRPTFAYWGWRGAAGPHESPVAIVPALAALELLHAFALVQDDVMDDASVRRGRASAHVALAAEHRARMRDGHAERWSRSAAILVGDLCLVWADALLADAGVPAATVLRARRVYDGMREETIAGQYLDVLGEASTSWSLRRAERVVALKTSAYTVVRPLHFGAALARLDACCPGPDNGGLTHAYLRYGTAVGEAFQLRDDLLDAYGDPADMGKPVGGDLASGRPTVLLELARRLASPAQRAELERALAAAADPGRLAALVARTGARDAVERQIHRRTTEALTVLRDAPLDEITRHALAALALRATERAA